VRVEGASFLVPIHGSLALVIRDVPDVLARHAHGHAAVDGGAAPAVRGEATDAKELGYMCSRRFTEALANLHHQTLLANHTRQLASDHSKRDEERCLWANVRPWRVDHAQHSSHVASDA
jgi:hypothetical protein